MPQRSADPGNHLRNATNIDTVMVGRPSSRRFARIASSTGTLNEAPRRNAEDANVVQVGLPLFLDDGIYLIIDQCYDRMSQVTGVPAATSRSPCVRSGFEILRGSPRPGRRAQMCSTTYAGLDPIDCLTAGQTSSRRASTTTRGPA